MPNPRAALIAQMARARGLDPAAVLSIASVEGGFNGAVGDNGTSFGPFQLHIGGALPKGIGNPSQWANSKAGISYALDHIAQVAGGLHGQQAISAISSRFERPANVPGEVAKASSRYGQFAGGKLPAGGPSPVAQQLLSQVSSGAGGGINPASLALLAQSMQNAGNTSGYGLLDMLAQRQQAQATQQTFGVVPKGVAIPVKGANPADPADMAAVKLASHYLGTPYQWGGANPQTGFDCSGLIQFVWGKQGVNIPRTTYDQWSAGQSVDPKALRPGDAVYFKGSDSISRNGQTLPGHVGMYIGNGKIIQAPYTGASVEITPLSSMPGFMGARRFG